MTDPLQPSQRLVIKLALIARSVTKMTSSPSDYSVLREFYHDFELEEWLKDMEMTGLMPRAT